jgi:hypothetical protein
MFSPFAFANVLSPFPWYAQCRSSPTNPDASVDAAHCLMVCQL